LSGELAQSPQLDVEHHLRTQYGSGYQPFIVMLRGDTRTLSNRPNAFPPNLGREARGRLMGRSGDWPRGGPPDGGRGGGPPDVGRWRRTAWRRTARRARRPVVAAARRSSPSSRSRRSGSAVVAVPVQLPPLSVGLREAAPTLISVGIALLGLGAAVMALVIFRPTHQRLRSLEDAARALGEGRTDVRANESGGDEVSALSDDVQQMAATCTARARRWPNRTARGGSCSADVSHELMTPLVRDPRLRRNAGHAGADARRSHAHRYLGHPHQETHKLEAIIGDLLDLARLEGGGDTLDARKCCVDDLFRRVAIATGRPAASGTSR
jgi:signal transduction histidine kinase